jgi:pre-mRNA-splicing factor CWC22
MKEGIEDRTEINLVNLRRVIYLTIMNALNYEEAVHKLLKIELQDSESQEVHTPLGLLLHRWKKTNRSPI